MLPAHRHFEARVGLLVRRWRPLLVSPAGMDMGSVVFLVSTLAAVVAIGLPLGLAAWRRRRNQGLDGGDQPRPVRFGSHHLTSVQPW